MKIIQPSFRLSTPYSDSLTIEDGIRLLKFIEQQARISHRSEDKQGTDTWSKFIQAVVLNHGDWSVTEHVSVTATIRTDRGVTHELVRHRLFSFTQESTRFVRYSHDSLQFIPPIIGIPKESEELWFKSLAHSESTYFNILENGGRPQEARSILPNSLASTIVVTGNLRNWRHFFLMRTSKETHPDFRRITIPMLAEFQKVIPLLYDDIVPEQRQIENLRKAR